MDESREDDRGRAAADAAQRRTQRLTPSGRTTIAHCIHGLGLGGAQQVVKLIVAKGDRGRFRHVVYSAEDGVFREPVERSGATVRIVPRLMRKLDPWHIRRLASEMRRDAPAIVHGHLFGDSLHGYLATRQAGKPPVLMTLHNDHQHLTALQRIGYRWLLKRMTRTVACSDSVRRSFLASWGEDAERILGIPNGIDARAGPPPDPATRELLRKRLGVSPETVIVASIGRMEEQKAQHHLIDAFARLVRSVDLKIRLVFLGDGSLRERLRHQAGREGVADRVLFAGFRPDVIELLPVLDVIAFSSLYEGLSIAMLEAMAAGRCIVGTDIPGITQAIRGEHEGLIVPVGDAEGLRQALQRAVTLPALRQRLGEAAQRRFFEHFRAERMVSRYEELYSEILAHPRRAQHGPPAQG